MASMALTHVLVTRFSFNPGRRQDERVITTNYTTLRPLAPSRLEKRFKLFEMFALPSVLGQTCRDFVWLLIIDRELKRSYRDRLRDLTRAHPRTHLVEHTPGEDLGSLRWVRPYVDDPATTHIATTNLDDDDLMSVGLMAYIRRYLRQLAVENRLPGCQLVGCTNITQWDLLPTRR